MYEDNKSGTTSRVFHACSAVARNDINIALFLLPHSTLQALLQTNHVDFIVQEVCNFQCFIQLYMTDDNDFTMTSVCIRVNQNLNIQIISPI